MQNETIKFEKEKESILSVCRKCCADCSKNKPKCGYFGCNFKHLSELRKNADSDIGAHNSFVGCVFDFIKKHEKEFKTEHDRVEMFHKTVSEMERICINSDIVAVFKKQLVFEWIKVLFSTFGSVPNILNLIDSLTLNRATFSTKGMGLNSYGENTLRQTEKIIDLIERKKSLIWFHQTVGMIFDRLSPKFKKFVELKFIKKLSSETVALMMGVDIRTVFRFAQQVQAEAYDIMEYLNITPMKLLKRLGENEPWVLAWFRP